MPKEASHRSTIITFVLAFLITAGAFAIGPRPLAMPKEIQGDPKLAQRVENALGPRPGIQAAAIGLIQNDSVNFAGIGTISSDGPIVDPHSSIFEIGSLTKPLTGMMFASMTPQVVEADSELEDVLGPEKLGAADLGKVTLSTIAHHKSGLPRLPLSPEILAGSFISRIGAYDPYPDWSVTRLISEAADAGIGENEFQYSNLGAAMLGHTLALAADQQYAALLENQILNPLGMDNTTVVSSPDGLPSNRVTGTDEFGRTQSPWVSPGFAPAGVGVWSTAEDMSILLEAILEGTAPGIGAAQLDAEIESEGAIGVGYFWLVSEENGKRIIWHDGATGGFQSWMGFNKEDGTGVVILTSGHNPNLHDLGIYLLGAGEPPVGQDWRFPGWYGVGVLAFLAFTMWRVLRAANRARQGKGTDHVGIISLSAEALGILTLGWVLGPWNDLPWAIWSLIAASTVIALAGFIWWNRDSEWFGGGIWRAFNMVVSVSLAIIFFVLVI